MSKSFNEFHSDLLLSAIESELLEWVGTAYGLAGQTKGVEADCSGLIVGALNEIGWSITDYTAAQLCANLGANTLTLRNNHRIFPQSKIPEIIGIGAPITHVGIAFHQRYVIHSTDDATWVSENGGDDGVMITSYASFLSRGTVLGTVSGYKLSLYKILQEHNAA